MFLKSNFVRAETL